MGDIIPERWATSNRNGGRRNLGMKGDINRNQHARESGKVFNARMSPKGRHPDADQTV